MATIINNIFKKLQSIHKEELLKVVDFLPPHPQDMLYQNSPKVFSPERGVF
jgi:hypothetical protein